MVSVHTSLVLVLSAAAGLLVAQPPQRSLTPELLWELKRVADPQLHPDGQRVLYTVRSYDLATNRGSAQLVLANLDSTQRRQLTTTASNWQGRFAPDGSKVAFLSTRAGAPQVFVLDLERGGDPVQVTRHAQGVDGFLWSPRGDRFAYVAAVALDKVEGKDLYPDLPLAQAKIYDDLMVRHWDSWKDGTYSHLFVIPAAGGEARDLLAGERFDTPLKPFGGIEQIAWSPDGSELCYTCRKVKDPATSTNSDLFLVPADGGASRNLTGANPGYDQDPVFSPDGATIVFKSMARAGFESDKARLLAWSRKSGEVRDLTRDFDQSAGDLAFAPDGRSVVFTSETKGTTQLYRVALAGGSPEVLTKGRFEHHAPQLTADGRAIVCLRQRTERPFELVVLPASGGDGVPISDENGAIYRDLALPQVRERWTKASDGQQIHSWVVLPPGFDPKQKYPMLLYCQGGPQSMVGQWFSFRWNFHLMAAQGYVVLAVNRRGLPGFGQAWNDQISGDWGGQAMQDLLAATDDLFTEPWIDRQRTAAVGASFGGYTVYWLMGNDQKNRFCAMVAHCGVFNLEAMTLATEELFFVDWDLGGQYWRDPKARQNCELFSPNRFLQRWDTPLLVIHGEKDFRVPLTEGLQAFTAARQKGVPARFLYLPEEGHWVSSPQTSVLWYRVFFDWLDRYCKKP